MRRPSLRLILVTMLAGAAGALLQWSASGGFAELSPSRMLTLPVAILLGPWHGIAATLIATITGDVRPLLLGLRLIEAAVIGAAARRGHSPLFIGTLLIVILALALGFAPELYDLPSAGANNWARAMQLLLNRMVPLVGSASRRRPIPDCRTAVATPCRGTGRFHRMRSAARPTTEGRSLVHQSTNRRRDVSDVSVILTLNNGFVTTTTPATWLLPTAILQPRFWKIGAQFDF